MRVLRRLFGAAILILFGLAMLWCHGYFTCVPDQGSNSCTYGTGGP